MVTLSDRWVLRDEIQTYFITFFKVLFQSQFRYAWTDIPRVSKRNNNDSYNWLAQSLQK
jgi:hypothetical protein